MKALAPPAANLVQRATVKQEFNALPADVQAKVEVAAQLDALGHPSSYVQRKLGVGPNETRVLLAMGRQYVKALYGLPPDAQARKVLAQAVLVVQQMGAVMLDPEASNLDKVAAAKALLQAVDRQAKLLRLWKFESDDVDPDVQALLLQSGVKAGAAAALLGVQSQQSVPGVPARPTHDMEAVLVHAGLVSSEA